MIRASRALRFGLGVTLLVASGCSASGPGGDPLPVAVAVDALSGTWTVISKPSDVGNCGGKDAPAPYQWLVSADPATREVTITVLGQTSFPKLRGSFDALGDKSLRLTAGGLSEGPRYTTHASSAFELTVKDGAFSGLRYFSSIVEDKAEG